MMNKIGKTLLFLSFFSLVAISCVKNEVEATKAEITEVKVNYESVKATDIYDVPVKAGYVTQVYSGGELIAQTTEAMTIEVPNSQFAALNRASNMFDVIYVPKSELPEYTEDSATCYKTLMFEDTKYSNDMDYNDLILHICQKIEGKNNWTLKIQPIAMGNTINLKFGGDFKVINATTKEVEKEATFYISNNVKADFFKESNTKKQINTDPEIELKGYPMTSYTPILEGTVYTSINYRNNDTSFLPSSMTGKVLAVNWFIENDNGDKFYAVPSTLTGNETWLDAKGYPYGLVITEIRGSVFVDSKNNKCGRDWINYPKERQHINTVYPGFKDWIQGGVYPEWAKPNDGTYIDAMRISEDGKTAVNSLFDCNIW